MSCISCACINHFLIGHMLKFNAAGLDWISKWRIRVRFFRDGPKDVTLCTLLGDSSQYLSIATAAHVNSDMESAHISYRFVKLPNGNFSLGKNDWWHQNNRCLPSCFFVSLLLRHLAQGSDTKWCSRNTADHRPVSPLRSIVRFLFLLFISSLPSRCPQASLKVKPVSAL